MAFKRKKNTYNLGSDSTNTKTIVQSEFKKWSRGEIVLFI